MPNPRHIRNRIKGIKSTAQITHAMQLVAASKIKRSQQKVLQGRPYALLLAQIVASIGQYHLIDFTHPFLQKRKVNTQGILLITSDKGLCGSLNTNLFRLVNNTQKNAKFVAIGRKGAQYLTRNQRTLIAQFTVNDNVSFSQVRPAVELMIENFEQKKIDTIEVIYSHFKNTLIQKPTHFPLLPLENLKKTIEEISFEENTYPLKQDERQMLFEPDPQTILKELLKLYIKEQIFRLILDAKASEHSARMVAMKTATDNSKKLIDELTLQYNRVRQANITQELLEISAAAAMI
jgi:F-type H+-transporting ATPase subunit gamma